MIYYPLMKKPVIFLILFSLLSLKALAADMKFGSLNVFSKIQGANIYVDGKLAGENEIKISEIQAGTHFLKITTGMGSSEATLYAEVVEIKAGESTTLYVSENGLEGQKPAQSSENTIDVYKAKRVLDYSREMHTGWYLKLGYLSNLYYNLDAPSLDNYASTLGIGLGYKIALAPNVDFVLEMERGQFTSRTSWYFMPITANILISYLPSPYFRGKQYYGIGLGYYITDLETQYKENLTTMGYHLFYGLEMPMGDKNALFFQFGYHQANLTRYDYALNASYVSVGYRWDIME
jgi:hypothetical protein